MQHIKKLKGHCHVFVGKSKHFHILLNKVSRFGLRKKKKIHGKLKPLFKEVEDASI